MGLGNIGESYAKNRHNLGFRVVDQLAEEKGLSFKTSSKFPAETAEFESAGEKIILAKPTTMMNLSGQAVRALSDFYKLKPENILVVHDEIDLPFGDIRLKQGGGSAGHNGLKSIMSAIGEDFWRLRFGINNELRDRVDASDFVLSNFNSNEQATLDEASLAEATGRIHDFIANSTKDSA